MPLISHLSQIQDKDQIVNRIYPILLKLVNYQVDAILEWEFGADNLLFTYKWPYKISGHQSGEPISLDKYTSLIHEDDRSDLENGFQKYLVSKEPIFSIKVRFVFPENQLVFAELITASLTDQNGKPERMITIIKDFTKLQQANDEVRDLTLAIENAMSGIAWLDTKGHFQMVQKDYASMLGYKPAELIGKSYKETVAEQDHELSYQAFLVMLKEGKRDVDLKAIRKDGSTFFKNILMIKTFDDAGNHNGHYCMMKDITGQVNYENAIRKQNVELIKVNQELDSLVYRVSHDLRAPIASSLGLCNLMAYSTDIEEIKKFASMQQSSLQRLDALIKDIHGYSINSQKAVTHDPIDVYEILNQTVAVQLKDNEDMKVTIDVKQTLPFISDLARFRIIFQHLISNAVKHSDISKEKRFIHINAEVTERKTFIFVEDNGIGIFEDFGDKIFEMFFRGSERSKGSGLGLYIVKEILTTLNGNITYSSIVGNGSCFKVEIPNEGVSNGSV